MAAPSWQQDEPARLCTKYLRRVNATVKCDDKTPAQQLSRG